MADTPSLFPSDEYYLALLNDLKQQVRAAQVKAVLSVNREMVLLYWSMGSAIGQQQQQEGWGSKVTQRLAQDLKREFSEMKGFSCSNRMSMKAFAEAWPDVQIVQQLVGQFPWGHNIRLLDKVKDLAERLWYIHKTIDQHSGLGDRACRDAPP